VLNVKSLDESSGLEFESTLYKTAVELSIAQEDASQLTTSLVMLQVTRGGASGTGCLSWVIAKLPRNTGQRACSSPQTLGTPMSICLTGKQLRAPGLESPCSRG